MLRILSAVCLLSLATGCVSAPADYQAPNVELGTPAACDRAMEAAQVWIARFGPENGVTGLQSASPVAIVTARPASDASAEVFVDVTRSNRAGGGCLIVVSANTWNPLSVNRALRVENAVAQAMRGQ